MATHITMHQGDLSDILDITARLQQQRTLMSRLGRAVHADTMLNFRRGVEPDGTPWLPITHRQGQPLRDTGRLQRSISWEATDVKATIGTNVIYARAHNFGVVGGVPPRTFLGLAAPQHKLINRIADQWIKEVLDGHAA
jgi:phage virion morphogenesis protein